MQVTDDDYLVSGDLTPDSTGGYWEAGINDGKPYYSRNGDWHIWWTTAGNRWLISQTVGVPGGPSWERLQPTIAGTYAPTGGATGTATVTEI